MDSLIVKVKCEDLFVGKRFVNQVRTLTMICAVKQMEAGRMAMEVAREIGVSKHTIYGWKAKFGGMNVSDAQRLRQLEEENRRLKQMVD